MDKRCSKCREVKDVGAFYKTRCSRDGLQSWCKICMKPALKASYARFYQLHKEERLSYGKRWRTENPEYHPHRKDPGAFLATVRERQIAKIKRTPKWADKKAIVAIYKQCATLNKKHGQRAFHVDHIVPLRGENVSGLHVPSNLQIVPAQANLTKRNLFLGA